MNARKNKLQSPKNSTDILQTMKPISIHDFLWEPSKFSSKAICVVFGNDPFWKFHAVRTLRDQVLSEEDAEFSLTRFEGDSVKFIDVLREVATHAMFGKLLINQAMFRANPLKNHFGSVRITGCYCGGCGFVCHEVSG